MPSRRRIHRIRILCLLAVAALAHGLAWPHDIPNQRVDRAIQVSVTRGRLSIDYEVALTELTLTQDLRALIGTLPGADRAAWLARYGEVTGPLNAKGILIAIDGRPAELAAKGYDLIVEEHPRYTFHFECPIPEQGRLSVHDTNYVSSEGTSRLAVRGRDGVVVQGDGLPSEVSLIAPQPIWLLSDADERRTKQVELPYRTEKKPAAEESNSDRSRAAPAPLGGAVTARESSRFGALLDDAARIPRVILIAIAVGLGAAHAIQPGHGKTIVTAIAIGPGARLYQPAILALATTLAHMGSVLILAAILWYTGVSRIGTVHVALSKIAGFAIAAAGCWRIGRYLGGFGEHDGELAGPDASGSRHLISLGIAAGVVPCWDAVGVLVLAAAVGRLATGVGLVFAFSAGMALVLVAVGCVAWKVKSVTLDSGREPKWQRGLGVLCGMMLLTIGLFLYFQA